MECVIKTSKKRKNNAVMVDDHCAVFLKLYVCESFLSAGNGYFDASKSFEPKLNLDD